MFRSVFCALALMAAPAAADVAVQFTEGAPKDSFRIMNTSACPTGPIDVTIDLGASAAGLIFDTTGSGAGVEVFQPFELTAGSAQVTSVSEITDGDSQAVLRLSDIPAKGTVAFTIDVDDTLPVSSNGQIMVSGAEIEGARIAVKTASTPGSDATFDSSGRATAAWEACVS